ncbi:D-glucuronyl C5-epimerase B [Cimex lectularius]|uniref:heparosan-N-sulfate-glucuronate 5-epimerase n=1 Tax=Cimex lectularius TaxID=79782 RepID=A0A8I6S411_CIMLE|nr:D-glucuronyl C5-epimerase B [Cimex lectularius]
MRINLKLTILCICICLTILSVSIWTRCGGEIPSFPSSFKDESVRSKIQSAIGSEGSGLEEIECHINGEYSVPCRKEGDEVYLPFSFIHKYFEVYGKIAIYDGYERFEWSHSYSKVYYPKGKYDPRGVFLYFENYNVELRERVKCISATEGVPVSTQWESSGYYYPTQVAQFGLAHYSKNLTEPEPRVKVLDDGVGVMGEWVTDYSKISRTAHTFVFNSSEGHVSLKLDHVLDFVLSVELMLKASENSSFTVVLQNREKKETWSLHYSCLSPLIYSKDQDVYHKIVCEDGHWSLLIRDLLIDLQKGLAAQSKPKKKLLRSKFKVTNIYLEGSGKLANLSLSTSRHLEQFYLAADWLVKHQDQRTGGWPNAVKRKGPLGMKDLQPGWLSAMGQGHGMSLLARAYYHSRKVVYLQSALLSLRPFHAPSSQGGVLAHFMGGLPWYEEYPTQPPSFVLNGFIYSLIGLYDLITLIPKNHEAVVLFNQGMASLKRLLPLFDNGSGSNYDLRHVSLGVAPNVARWDYHATHVNQLLLLATLDNSTVLSSTAERWLGYMAGKRAAHN